MPPQQDGEFAALAVGDIEKDAVQTPKALASPTDYRWMICSGARKKEACLSQNEA